MISKKKALVGAIIIVIVTTILNITVGNFIAIQMGHKVVITRDTHQHYKGIMEQYGKLFRLKDYLLTNYFREIDEDLLLEGAIRGMFDSIGDPYTVFLNEREYRDLMTRTQGSYGGIGVIVTPGEDGYVTVVSPIEGTPGDRAGLRTGDRIILVDGVAIYGDRLDQAVDLMKGTPGTGVTLSIRREGFENLIEVKIVREEIRLQTVRSQLMDENIGYIRLSGFDERTSEDFRRHLSELEKNNIKGLIIDLRNNPGGLLTQCIRIADMLLADQVIVYTEDRHGNREIQRSNRQGVDYPLVVLVNEGSASASEILAGAIRDGGAGTLVGTTTFGKGLVQQFRALNDGTGFKFTVSQYFTPNGTNIHGTGIEPHIVVEMPKELEGGQDPQLEKALEVIREKIGN